MKYPLPPELLKDEQQLLCAIYKRATDPLLRSHLARAITRIDEMLKGGQQ